MVVDAEPTAPAVMVSTACAADGAGMSAAKSAAKSVAKSAKKSGKSRNARHALLILSLILS
jgi:hypothetical protein